MFTIWSFTEKVLTLTQNHGLNPGLAEFSQIIANTCSPSFSSRLNLDFGFYTYFLFSHYPCVCFVLSTISSKSKPMYRNAVLLGERVRCRIRCLRTIREELEHGENKVKDSSLSFLGKKDFRFYACLLRKKV